MSSPSSNSIPAKWAWHYRTLESLRRRLAGEREEHKQDSAAVSEVDMAAGFADAVSDRNERDVLAAAVAMEEGMLAEIEAALERIREGSYGVCEFTGKTIPDERLRALPWTRFTREAAEQLEKSRRR